MNERFTEELPNTPSTAEYKANAMNSRQERNSGKSQASFYLAHQEDPAGNQQSYSQQGGYQHQQSYEQQQLHQQPIQPYQQLDQPYQEPSQPYQQASHPYQQPSQPYQQASQPYQEPSQPYQQASHPYQQPSQPYQQPSQPYQEPSQPYQQPSHPYQQQSHPYQQQSQPYQQQSQPYQQSTQPYQQPSQPYQQQSQPYQQQSQPYQQSQQSYQLPQDQHQSSYPQSDPYAEQYQSPYQPNQHVLYEQQPPLSSERDEEEYRFVSSRLADVEEASEPLIKSSDLMKPGAAQQRPGSEEADLKREIAYQEKMRRRLQKQQEEFAQMANVVPPLNLSHASTPREEGARDSLDISLRSDSEEDAVGTDFDPSDFYKQGQPHMPPAISMGAPHRLSAQHRAEMAHVLSSLGNGNRSGADLAIDKDFYDSSRHAQDSDSRKGGGGTQDTENMEFLMKIHAYNQALQQRAQEEAWNNRAAVAAAATVAPAANQKRAAEKGGQRLGQSAPPEANVPKKNPTVPAKGRRRNTVEDLNSPSVDYVERNKSLREQRGRQTSYTDRYKQKHTKMTEVENSGHAPIHEEHREISQRSTEPRVAFAARPGGVLAPISVPVTVPLPPELRARGESLTFDVNVRVQAGPDPRSQGSEREQEWAFVHDPENVFNPPSPRARHKLTPSQQARLKFDSHLLDEQLHVAGILPQHQQQYQHHQQYQHQQQLRSPPTKYPPLPPIARQPESEEGRRPLAARNQENAHQTDTGYLDIFRGTSDRKPQYKKYTLREFKNLRTIAAMGGLGPDFDNEAYRQQQERNLRRRQYGQQIDRRNQEEIAKSPKKPPPQEESKQRKFVHPTATILPSKHQLMKEYVKGLENRPALDKAEEKRAKEQHETRQKEKHLSRKVFDTKALNEILNDTEHERLKRRHEEERFAQERIRAQNTAVVQP